MLLDLTDLVEHPGTFSILQWGGVGTGMQGPKGVCVCVCVTFKTLPP